MGRGIVVLAAAALATAGDAQLATAATATASFGVSVTVIAGCTVAPSLWSAGLVCLRRLPGPAIRLAAAPLVSFSRDSDTGMMIKTIAF